MNFQAIKNASERMLVSETREHFLRSTMRKGQSLIATSRGILGRIKDVGNVAILYVETRGICRRHSAFTHKITGEIISVLPVTGLRARGFLHYSTFAKYTCPVQVHRLLCISRGSGSSGCS